MRRVQVLLLRKCTLAELVCPAVTEEVGGLRDEVERNCAGLPFADQRISGKKTLANLLSC